MKKLPLLIVAYQRPDFLRKILGELPAFVSEVYISVDFPKDLTPQSSARFLEIIKVVSDFNENFEGKTIIHTRTENVGCSAAVVSSCDWFFSQVNYGAILEDDCIPSQNFFEFVLGAENYLVADSKILLVCGHQVVPKEIIGDSWAIGRFPLIWGWGTSALKWKVMKSLIVSGDFVSSNPGNIKIDLKTFSFFQAGARRSHDGYMDAWDAPLAFGMIANNYRAILPPRNLIRNVGNDSVAVHTTGKSRWLNTSVEPIAFHYSSPVDSQAMEEWLVRRYYKIRLRHLLTTKITRLLDLLRTPRFEKLPDRISKARISN